MTKISIYLIIQYGAKALSGAQLVERGERDLAWGARIRRTLQSLCAAHEELAVNRLARARRARCRCKHTNSTTDLRPRARQADAGELVKFQDMPVKCGDLARGPRGENLIAQLSE
jgi:hypothetical protein